MSQDSNVPGDQSPEEQLPQDESPQPAKKRGLVPRIAFGLITLACFGYLYWRIGGAAAREGQTLVAYMTDVFQAVNWGAWLLVMLGYSIFYFLIDTLVLSRALSWFIKDIRYRDILPIRASAYILSVINEQIGKGAMGFYLYRRHQVPGWEVGSVMLFIMFCEVFYLLVWAVLGYFVTRSALPAEFDLIPVIGVAAAIFLVLWIAFFQSSLLPKIREQRILHAFRIAGPMHYLKFFLIRSPALIAAIVVYTVALNLFGVEADLLDVWPYLPVIFFAAAIPTPMRAAAITLWVILFPDNEGQMAAFGFVQHNFFILFNALIGLLFWRVAQRELAVGSASSNAVNDK